MNEVIKENKQEVKRPKVYAARHKEAEFVSHLQEGMNQTEAVLATNGYNPKDRVVASQMGTELLKRPTVLALLHSKESKAEAVIVNILEDDSVMEKDRLAAAKLILAYTQGNPISRSENVNVSVSLEDILRSSAQPV